MTANDYVADRDDRAVRHAPITIRHATEAQLGEIKAIADCEKDALGFVHRGSLMRSIERGEVIVALHDGITLGFCQVYRRHDGVISIYHLAVVPSWRRQGIGTALVNCVANEAQLEGAHVIRLKCPEELSANRFYVSRGFTWAGTESGTRRHLNIYVLHIQNLESHQYADCERLGVDLV